MIMQKDDPDTKLFSTLSGVTLKSSVLSVKYSFKYSLQ